MIYYLLKRELSFSDYRPLDNETLKKYLLEKQICTKLNILEISLNLKNYQDLDLQGFRLSELKANGFIDFPDLKCVYLYWNNLRKINAYAFNGLNS